jgi:cytochrome c-type biogenesis protein CcmH
VQVTLAPDLAAHVQPGDTLFVFARAAEGPRMPLAISRRRADELPLTVTLDDSMAMQPQLKLSAFDRVVVGARISRSGNAIPQTGDLEGQTAPIAPSGSTAIQIERQRP